MHSRHMHAHSRSHQRCTCRVLYKYKPYGRSTLFRDGGKSTPARWNAASFASTLVHRRDCALFNETQEAKQFGLRISFCGSLLQGAVQVAMSMTRGSGGFSISPVLAFDRIVSSNTAPFRILNFSFNGKTTAADMQATFDFRKKELLRLYQEGKASPRDIDENGNTVMHVSLLRRHSCSIQIELRSD